MGAPAARAAELSRHWVRAGHEVTVLTGFPNHPTGVVCAEYRKHMRRLVCRERFDGIRVVRTWLWTLPNGRPLQRMANYCSFFLSASASGLFLDRPEVVIATSPQLLVALSGYWLARIKRVPFVFEVRDLWPESLAAVGVGDANSPLHRVLAGIAGYLYRHSDHIVVVTNTFRQHLVEKWRVPQEKISVVENGVETDLFLPSESDATRKEHKLEGKFVACYVGTMGMAHGLATLVEAAEQLAQQLPDVVFLLVGEGAEKQRIMELAASKRLTNIRFVNQQLREKIPGIISASDCGLVLLKKTDVFKTVIPTKMLEFMACECPVVLGVDGEARDLLEHADAGIFVEPENAGALANAITMLYCRPELREEFGKNGRRFILQHLSREQTAHHYLAVIDALLHQDTGLAVAAAR